MELRIANSQDIQEIRNFWNAIYLEEKLKDNETIRIVPQIKLNDGKQNIFTINNQINSIDGFLKFVENMDKQYGFGNVGYSISSAIFNYNPENKDANGNVVKPNISTFNRIKTINIDIDFYLAGSKDRFVLGFIDETYINFAMLNMYLAIIEKFKENNIEVIKPKIAGLTGSGLQLIFELDRWINKDESTVLFNMLKRIIGKMTKDLVLKDSMGTLVKVTAEVDATFADIAHVQRTLGTINQKYGILARELDIFKRDNLEDAIEEIKTEYQEYIENSDFPVTSKVKYNNYINHTVERIKTVILNESTPYFPVEKYLQVAKMEQYSKKTMIKPSELKNIESELLYKLKENEINVVNLLRDYITIDHESSQFVALKCPFHDDSKYSFAIYINDTIDIFYDFHDGKSYTLITFWEKLFEVSKTTAISQIAQAAGLKLGKSERKDYQDLEIEEVIDHMLDKIDTESYIYYRLANKNRVCIVRHRDSGEAFIFDGPKMLANHVLENQLNVKDVDLKFIQKFQERFQEKILIDAFEEFHPGKPTVFQREFIKFVNLWVPSKNYKLAKEKSKEIKEEIGKIDIRDSIGIIKDKTPWTFKYLQQLTQKGNMLWFINWLTNTAKFNVMPTIPVVFGVPGVGKNLFVNTILEWFHNNEYTKTLNSDRVMSNFNSVLESASIVVLDEGDISSSRDFDALKFLSGNDKIAIEKKGVDVQMKQRFFNIIMFSNGDVPVRHHYSDRRIQYFLTENTLLQSCKQWGISIEEFISNIELELEEFWGILLNINSDPKWNISNEKDKLFIVQILKQHSFGELILKLLNGNWKDIALQLNENISDPGLMKANLELLQEIKNQFENESKLSLTLINRYLQALNFRYKTSIQKFIQQNNLQDIGIEIEVTLDDVLIKINKNKLENLINIPNLLNIKDYKSLDRFVRVFLNAVDSIIDTESKFIEEEKLMESQEIKVKEDEKKRLESIGVYDKDSPEIDPEGLFKKPEVKEAEEKIEKIYNEISSTPTPPPAPDLNKLNIPGIN